MSPHSAVRLAPNASTTRIIPAAAKTNSGKEELVASCVMYSIITKSLFYVLPSYPTKPLTVTFHKTAKKGHFVTELPYFVYNNNQGLNATLQ